MADVCPLFPVAVAPCVAPWHSLLARSSERAHPEGFSDCLLRTSTLRRPVVGRTDARKREAVPVVFAPRLGSSPAGRFADQSCDATAVWPRRLEAAVSENEPPVERECHPSAFVPEPDGNKYLPGPIAPSLPPRPPAPGVLAQPADGGAWWRTPRWPRGADPLSPNERSALATSRPDPHVNELPGAALPHSD